MSYRNKALALVLLLSCSVYSQRQFEESLPNYLETERDLPYFYYDVAYNPLLSRQKIKFDIMLQIPFGAVQFVKKDTLFEARYEISILLLDENEISAASKIWTQTIRTNLFSETSSLEHYDINRVSFELKPSKYFLTIGVRDLDSRKSSFRKKTIDLKDFYQKELAIGSLNLTEPNLQDSSATRDEIPSIIGSLNDTDPNFEVSFGLLTNGGKATIKYSIYSSAKKPIIEKSYEKEFPKGVVKETITISKAGLAYSRYRLVIKVKMGREEVSSERLFQVRWYGMSNLIDNLDKAIEQLRYIATAAEMKSMRKAKENQKKEEFLKFWQKRDPTPNTPENELMNEYYKRVNYANAHFTGFLEGWRTDMGMVFILFGPPSDIERHPFELNTKPYEVWYYYEINRTFVFVDESGFGDYRLVTPFELYDTY
jgi:GWxTD domain-containing protein